MFLQKLSVHRIFKRTAHAMISLRVCAGWSEPLQVTHITLLEISCRGSFATGKCILKHAYSEFQYTVRISQHGVNNCRMC